METREADNRQAKCGCWKSIREKRTKGNVTAEDVHLGYTRRIQILNGTNEKSKINKSAKRWKNCIKQASKHRTNEITANMLEEKHQEKKPLVNLRFFMGGVNQPQH